MAQAHLTACHHCDQLVQVGAVDKHHLSICPRCHSPLEALVNDDLAAPLAFSLSGLILAIPANTMPIMTLSILGKSNANTMINGVVQLWDGGFWWMAALVLVCSVVAPLALLLNVCSICLLTLLGCSRQTVGPHLRFFPSLATWAMADVYMLGILVAYVKMLDLGDITIGTGLYCFIAMLLLITLTRYYFDPQAVWRQLEVK